MKAFSRPPCSAMMRENSPGARFDLRDHHRRTVVRLDDEFQTVVELVFMHLAGGEGQGAAQQQRQAQD
ncbi:MAG: hypothetical protein LC646_12100 [Xanthomonadaceae bacterium]|nr:hypothetical protein [Xanthomonadaceae bacterium]